MTVVLALSLVALTSMVLSLTDCNTAIRKARGQGRSAGVQEALRALAAHINTIKNPDLQFVSFSALQTADGVVANVACVLFACYFKKPAASTVDSWLKASDHATVAAANGDLVFKLKGVDSNSATLGNREYCALFGEGLPFGTGLTFGAHTTVNGNTKSLVADAPTGFAIIGAGL